MDEKPVAHPGVPDEQYHTLGKKTFWIFLLQRVSASMVLLLVAVALLAIKDEPFLRKTPAGNLSGQAALIAWAALGLFVVVFLITLLVAWIIYKNYKYFLGDNALKIKRGIFNKEEVAMPYRQIQNVDIQRDFSFQMMGLSRLVILSAGEEDKNEKGEDGESEGVLPAIDKDLAEWLQKELLERANVQKVTETSPAQ